MEKKIIKPAEMQLGDRVRMTWDNITPPFMDSVVKQIKDRNVTLFRPYVTTADFSYTGGVICYIGIDQWNIAIDSSTEFILLERVELK